MIKKTTNESTYRGFKVNSGNSKEHACFTKTLDQIVDTIEYMLSRHSKVISVRIDIQSAKHTKTPLMTSPVFLYQVKC